MSMPQILVVEDESIVAKDIQDRLISMGYSVPTVALSVEQAEELSAALLDFTTRAEVEAWLQQHPPPTAAPAPDSIVN